MSEGEVDWMAPQGVKIDHPSVHGAAGGGGARIHGSVAWVSGVLDLAGRVAGPEAFMAPETSEHLGILCVVMMMAGGDRDVEHNLKWRESSSSLFAMSVVVKRLS